MLVEAESNTQALASANTDLESANARLAREAADQAQFLAVTAHELRSPIGVLAGSAQLLVDHLDELTAEDRDELRASVVGSAERLQRLLRALLTAARLEAGTVHIEMRDVDLADVLTRAVSSARAANPAAVITLDVPAGLHTRGDGGQLAQAVDNLIGNAVRHGHPPVAISAAERGDRVEVRVSDCGGGVSPEMRDRLFERFASGTPRSGTGLGLFIVRELVRAHGGESRYEVDAHGRPTFVLDLPVSVPGIDAQVPGMP
jgi:signal transduction histidine kinase